MTAKPASHTAVSLICLPFALSHCSAEFYFCLTVSLSSEIHLCFLWWASVKPRLFQTKVDAYSLKESTLPLFFLRWAFPHLNSTVYQRSILVFLFSFKWLSHSTTYYHCTFSNRTSVHVSPQHLFPPLVILNCCMNTY